MPLNPVAELYGTMLITLDCTVSSNDGSDINPVHSDNSKLALIPVKTYMSRCHWWHLKGH